MLKGAGEIAQSEGCMVQGEGCILSPGPSRLWRAADGGESRMRLTGIASCKRKEKAVHESRYHACQSQVARA